MQGSAGGDVEIALEHATILLHVFKTQNEIRARSTSGWLTRLAKVWYRTCNELESNNKFEHHIALDQ